MEITVGVIVITRNPDFFESGFNALHDVREVALNRVEIDTIFTPRIKKRTENSVYQEAFQKAVRYLSSLKEKVNIRVIQGGSLSEALEKIFISSESETASSFQVGMIFYDQSSMEKGYEEPSIIETQISSFYERLKSSNIPAFFSSYSAAVFVKELHPFIRYQPQQYIECILPDDPEQLQTELLCLWMDFFERSYLNRRVKPIGPIASNNRVGEQILAFMNHQKVDSWILSYYTGSVVSSLIRYLEDESEAYGAKILRGPNEHALACGAMANWQLYQTPFLLVVTSGMIDEFKGTLANLRETRAKGLIIVAENRPEQWFAFQGTITNDEDTRDVLKAKRIPFVYIKDIDDISEKLSEAFTLYHGQSGPVVILASSGVLESATAHPESIAEKLSLPAPIPKKSEHEKDRDNAALNEVIDLINHGPEKILWQCGPLDEEELALTLSIAEKSGIALADSLVYPGSVPKYIDGKLNPYFLGTLAIYGYSNRIYHYLFDQEGRLNPKTDQSIFFIKSKIGQVATPIPEGKLRRQIHTVQLSHNKDHIAPFADISLTMNCKEFLTTLNSFVNVSPELKEKRLVHLQRGHQLPSDVISKVPKTPMTANYFFNQLNQMVEKMITDESYDYLGVYDVGRCGISAIRNVSKTRRGFSGWYGRALMGDALLATMSLIHTSDQNIVAFIGDGAKNIVPEIIPSFLENTLNAPHSINKNITIFYLCNGGHSVISTYREQILSKKSSRQMRLVNYHQPDWEDEFCGVRIDSKTLRHFDSEALKDAMTQKNRLNLYSVVMSHNNEGDGLSLVNATGWQRDLAEITGSSSARCPTNQTVEGVRT